jgi:hypothetical protein
MKFRHTVWLTSLSAAVALFFGRRLKALGEVIAAELERSYPGLPDDFSSRGKQGPKLPAGIESPDSEKKRKELQKKRKDRSRRASPADG